jgi:hypothetical protein
MRSRRIPEHSPTIRALIARTGSPQPTILDDEQYPLPQTDELIAARWPTNKDRLGRAILALALRQGGLDLADGSTVSRANLPKREYHHLFPDAHLARLGIADAEIYRSLNCALVTWQTNRSISDKEPERYLAERRKCISEEKCIIEEEVRQRLSSHLIPYDEMIAGCYQAFLKKRAALVQEKMLKLCQTGIA